MLIDMRAQEYLLSESEASEAGDGPWPPARTSGRGVVGAGRLMTPENSQENRVSPAHSVVKALPLIHRRIVTMKSRCLRRVLSHDCPPRHHLKLEQPTCL